MCLFNFCRPHIGCWKFLRFAVYVSVDRVDRVDRGAFEKLGEGYGGDSWLHPFVRLGVL